MSETRTRSARAPAGEPKRATAALDATADSVIAELQRLSSKRVRDGMARYAIPSDNALGVSVGGIRDLGKRLGKRHDLIDALWKTGVYEARMLVAFVADPALLTSALMDRLAKDFDNWAIVDTLCFHLFDKTPHAWDKVAQWANRKDEFGKRAAFALLWGLTVHDKRAADEAFIRCLPLIERAATDERNFVKKAVNMALRATGKRNPALHAAAVATAQRLADSPDPTARWVGKDALRELAGASVTRRLAAHRSARKKRADG